MIGIFLKNLTEDKLVVFGRANCRPHLLPSNQGCCREVTGFGLAQSAALYPRAVKKVLGSVPVKAIAHITGGGLRNIQRVLPEGLTHHVDRKAIPCPPVIRLIAEAGDVSEGEAFTVWNMGLGYVFVVSPHAAQGVLNALPEAFVCGEIVRSGK